MISGGIEVVFLSFQVEEKENINLKKVDERKQEQQTIIKYWNQVEHQLEWANNIYHGL